MPWILIDDDRLTGYRWLGPWAKKEEAIECKRTILDLPKETKDKKRLALEALIREG